MEPGANYPLSLLLFLIIAYFVVTRAVIFSSIITTLGSVATVAVGGIEGRLVGRALGPSVHTTASIRHFSNDN